MTTRSTMNRFGVTGSNVLGGPPPRTEAEKKRYREELRRDMFASIESLRNFTCTHGLRPAFECGQTETCDTEWWVRWLVVA